MRAAVAVAPPPPRPAPGAVWAVRPLPPARLPRPCGRHRRVPWAVAVVVPAVSAVASAVASAVVSQASAHPVAEEAPAGLEVGVVHPLPPPGHDQRARRPPDQLARRHQLDPHNNSEAAVPATVPAQATTQATVRGAVVDRGRRQHGRPSRRCRRRRRRKRTHRHRRNPTRRRRRLCGATTTTVVPLTPRVARGW